MALTMTRSAFAAVPFVWVLSVLPAAAPLADEDVWLSFVPGRFVLIGRNPDNGDAYAGTAIVSRLGNAFSLERTIGAKTIRARGSIDVPYPPGEGKVLRFRWHDGSARLMTCLVSGDLDNYPRLTCQWGCEADQHLAPGLEAYFSRAE